MKTTTKIKLLSSATSAVVLMTSGAAFAQTAPAADDTADETQPAIVITGSLIRNPNLEQANPVNVTTADTIELRQSNLAEEVLREVPGIVPSIGSAVNNGNGGSSYVDLRGLGSNRNIVLLDGNRIAPADLQGRVDLNNIPLALVARVDALTGAAVTTYGADAVTGVVNFITKKDFAGVDVSVGNQITERGDGHFFRMDVTVGANFDDGRGNAVLSIGYQESDPVYQGARDFSIFGIDSTAGSLGGSGTSVPSRFPGTRPLAGAVPNTTPESVFTGRGAVSTAFPLGVPIYAANPGGAANGGTRQINSAGQAVGTFAFFNFNPYNIFQTPFQRYNMFAQANYEVSDAVEIYTRGLFSKNTVSTIIAPSGSFGAPVQINLNNPYLPASLAAQFCAFDVNPRPDIYTPRFRPDECATARTSASGTGGYRVVGAGGALVPFDVDNNGIIDGDGDGVADLLEGYNPNPGITLARRLVEGGPRISEYSTTVFDYRLGLRGALTDSIDWDVSGSYGESEKVQTIKGYVLTSRVQQSLLANNTTTCQTNTNGCVPLNAFGEAGTITPSMINYLVQQSTSTIRTSLAQARAVIAGDLGITLGASEPVGFAIGTEYRKYQASQSSDLLAKTPGELGGAGGASPDIDGGYDVYEAYGELIVPLLADMPGFHSLTVEGGARYSRYSVDGGPTNETWTYKGGLTWEPIADIKLRGNYARAVRAPNVGELFTPVTTGLTTLNVDPCAGAAPTTNANLRAICIAQGASVGTIGSITNPTAAQANSTGGGNINLAPEKATTWTLGAVFQPAFAPGFSLSVDYYNITVNDAITTPTSGDVMAACFGAPPYNAATAYPANAGTAACTSIRRNPVTGGLDGDPSTTRGLPQGLSNTGRLFTDGIDVIANYSRDLGFAKWQSSFVFNYTLSQTFRSNVASPLSVNRECVGLYSADCGFSGSIAPKYQWTWRNTLTVDEVDVSFLWRHISGVEHETGGLFAGTIAGLPAPLNTQALDFNSIPAYDWFDMTVRFNVTDNFSMTASIQNMLDKQPPIVGSSAGTTSFNSGNTYPSTYDSLGRRFAVSARLKF